MLDISIVRRKAVGDDLIQFALVLLCLETNSAMGLLSVAARFIEVPKAPEFDDILPRSLRFTA